MESIKVGLLRDSAQKCLSTNCKHSTVEVASKLTNPEIN